MAAHVRSFFQVHSVKLVSVTLALSVACAAAEEPEDDGNAPRPPSGGSAAGGTGGSPGGGSPGTAGKPPGTSGSTTGTSGSAAGGTSSVGGTGAGGTPATTGGTAGTPAAGGTAAGTCPPYTGTLATDSLIFMGGFGTSTVGMWSGYGYTYKYGTATIAPGTGNSCFAGAKFCANGTVPADDKAGAGLGWNIAQMQGASTMSKVAVTTAVKITFAGVPSGSRVQLSASATVSYCYPLTDLEITAGTATIPAASFKTDCWGTLGTAYDTTTLIEAIQIAVPGSTAGAAKTFDMCIKDIEPG
jgi:hypothetical protein